MKKRSISSFVYGKGRALKRLRGPLSWEKNETKNKTTFLSVQNPILIIYNSTPNNFGFTSNSIKITWSFNDILNRDQDLKSTKLTPQDLKNFKLTFVQNHYYQDPQRNLSPTNQ